VCKYDVPVLSEQGAENLPEVVVEPAVNKWVVATITDGQPMASEKCSTAVAEAATVWMKICQYVV
jgi:hypothetical protein